MSETTNVQTLEITNVQTLERMQQEYTEVNNNIRHYSLLRFTVLTVYFAAFGGIASVAFGFFVPQSGSDEHLKLGGRIAGFLVTFLFAQYEYLVVDALDKNRKRGKNLEKHLLYNQITSRSSKPIIISQYTLRVFYCLLLLFWMVMIIISLTIPNKN
jgi:hypothetical protein